MPIIYFFGPDGSGKTTFIRALTEILNREGYKVRLSWMRGTHTLASLLARFLSKFKSFKGSNNPYYGITIPRNLKRVWQLIEFASIIPIILLKYILPSTLGYWVVADRYVLDFIVWVSITTNDQRYLKSVEAKFLLALSSKTHVRIYVTATIKELLRRRKEDIHYLREQLKIYNQIALDIHANILDTTDKSTDKSFKEVLRLLKEMNYLDNDLLITSGP